MDKYIEIFVFYLSEWQQVAINNVQYSVVIALGSLLIGVFLVVLLKRKNSVSLKQKLMQQNHALEQSEHKHDKLLITQKNDAENISSLQQQIDQLTKDLQESEKQHNELIQQEALTTKALDVKQFELDGLESTVNEKNQRVDQLQSELDEQKIQVSEEQTQLVVMEKEVSELSNKLNNVEQQIQTQLVELTNKNELIAQLELSAQSSEKNLDEVSELKSEIPKQKVDGNIEQLLVLENTLQQQNQQMTLFNEKLQSLLIQPNADTGNENSLTDANQASGGLFNKFLSKMSFLDNDIKTGAEQSHANEPVFEDVWQQHQKIIDQLIEQLSVQYTKPDVQTVDIEDERLSPKDTEEAVAQNSTQGDESADEMDQLKLKLKGFYRKLIS